MQAVLREHGDNIAYPCIAHSTYMTNEGIENSPWVKTGCNMGDDKMEYAKIKYSYV